ncbi:hypothetical protein HK104_009706 [Borealophlyctis nickersoniae]|nr:hypothetical protein HK104_009706 [Borealophlyctis nickersoniae]
MHSSLGSVPRGPRHGGSIPSQPGPPAVPTRTLHVSYNRLGPTDRGESYLHFRKYPGFELFAFYDHYCFVRFLDQQSTGEALLRPVPKGLTVEAAKQAYEVPYPQPNEDVSPSNVIHATHLPTNYTKQEMIKIFLVFDGFLQAQFHGKYGYIYFDTETNASKARNQLRAETNFVITFAKHARPLELVPGYSPQMDTKNIPVIQVKNTSSNAHAPAALPAALPAAATLPTTATHPATQFIPATHPVPGTRPAPPTFPGSATFRLPRDPIEKVPHVRLPCPYEPTVQWQLLSSRKAKEIDISLTERLHGLFQSAHLQIGPTIGKERCHSSDDEITWGSDETSIEEDLETLYASTTPPRRLRLPSSHSPMASPRGTDSNRTLVNSPVDAAFYGPLGGSSSAYGKYLEPDDVTLRLDLDRYFDKTLSLFSDPGPGGHIFHRGHLSTQHTTLCDRQTETERFPTWDPLSGESKIDFGLERHSSTQSTQRDRTMKSRNCREHVARRTLGTTFH